MNTQVTATGMQVKAVAEDGLLIKNELDEDNAANWKVSTQASYASQVDLAPTSTANVTNWYHNKSNDQNNAMPDQAAATYETLSTNADWMRDEGSGKTGVYFIDSDHDDTKDTTEKAYVLLNKFYIKSSGDMITLGADPTYTYKDLYVNKVIVSGASGSANLDASLRVAVKVNSTLYIYAPVSGATTTYHVAGYTGDANSPTYANTVNAVVVPADGIVNSTTLVNGTSNTATIPAVTATSGWVEADVYIYFEGEDAGLKSANLVTTLDTLTVQVMFGITTVSSS